MSEEGRTVPGAMSHSLTIEEYLTSPKAVENVRFLASHVRFDAQGEPIALNPWPRAFADKHEMLAGFAGQRWVALWIEHDGEPQCRVYYRPDGERFVVTDLGDAVRALRLRTGLRATAADALQWNLLDGASGLDVSDGEIAAIDGDTPTVAAPDLPRAICAVLLAANRVANRA